MKKEYDKDQYNLAVIMDITNRFSNFQIFKIIQINAYFADTTNGNYLYLSSYMSDNYVFNMA